MTKKSPKTSKKSTSPKQRPLWLRLIKWGFIAFVWVVIVGLITVAWFARDVPKIAETALKERKPSVIVVAADDSVITRYGEYFQEHVRVKDLPDYVGNAVLGIEDRRFYYHFGMDPIGLTRAIFTNMAEGGVVQGGSTITQQLAKNLFLSPERSLKRKLQELVLAFWLEFSYTKDEILSAYLNRVYYGSGAFGIEAAARVYYDRPAHELTLYQAAALAGLLKAPAHYAPHRNPEASDKRAQLVLQAMEDGGYITEEERNKAIKNKSKAINKNGGSEKYYTDWVLDQLDIYVKNATTDLIVKTTYEPKIQAIATNAFDASMSEASARKVSQGAVVVMRADGAVLALIGGKSYSKSSFNRATQARRQPGSSFKPFVYLSALEKGIGPERLVLDAPFIAGKYRPKNYDDKYRGPISLADALRLSLNTATIRLADHIGIRSVIDTARRAGISTDLEPNISLALGTTEMTLLDLTGAYASFARMGEVNEPYAIVQVKTSDDEILYDRERDDPSYKGSQRFNQKAIAQLRGMLAGVVNYGTGTGARLSKYQGMGKTGTSQDYRDAWFMGFTDDLVTGVWMGNDDNTSMSRVTGGSFPAPLWRDIMNPSLEALYAKELVSRPLSKNDNYSIAATPSDPDEENYAEGDPQDDPVRGVMDRLFGEPQSIGQGQDQGYDDPYQQPTTNTRNVEPVRPLQKRKTWGFNN